MLVSQEEVAVYRLAYQIVQRENVAIAQIRQGLAEQIIPRLAAEDAQWAVRYLACLPEKSEDAQLVHSLFLEPQRRWYPEETQRAAKLLKAFKQCLDEQRLFAKGRRLLNASPRI